MSLLSEPPRQLPLKPLGQSYTCFHCNYAWNTDDPGYDPTDHGWFGRCVDREACAQRRTNNHAGVAYGQLPLAGA